MKKQKYLNLRSKMPHLSIFGLEFENNIVIFQISLFLVAKFREIIKKAYFRDKIMPYLGYFWAGI